MRPAGCELDIPDLNQDENEDTTFILYKMMVETPNVIVHKTWHNLTNKSLSNKSHLNTIIVCVMSCNNDNWGVNL